MCGVLLRVEEGGLDCWPDPDLNAALLAIEARRGRVDAAQALVFAELVRRARAPETMFGSKLSPHDALRRAAHRETRPVTEAEDGSTGATGSGGRWFRFRFDAHDGTTIDGIPLPVDVVRKMLVNAKIYPIVIGGDGEILDFGRSRRYFSAAQRKAAAVRDLSCQFADCDKPIRYTEHHHCQPWAQGGTTDTYDPNGQRIHQRTNRGHK